MSIEDMRYRTKTYIAADWDGDKDLVDKLYEWNNNRNLALSFVNVHEVTQCSDDTLNCNIKKSLRQRLNITKTFVLIVGEKTASLRSGKCCCCNYYQSFLTIEPKCNKGYHIDNRSYVQYECEMAVKDFDDGLLKNIVVIYNGMVIPDKTKCPEVIRRKGTHIGSDCYNDRGGLCWNYFEIMNAICK